jgi:hypothetical protein
MGKRNQMTKQQKILLSEDYLCACDGAVEFIGNKSLEKAWETAKRPDWMMWLIEKIGYSDRRKLVLIATRAIRETPGSDGKFVFDLLPANAVAPFLLIERYALGEDISKDEIAYAARAAAYAADAADAAYAAADAADAAYAARAARAAAYAAAYAAYAAADAADAIAAYAADAIAAYAAYAAYAAADAAARKIQCNIIRSIITWPEVSKLINNKIKELGIE